MNTNYCVYYHRNIINNKLYIGMTKNASARWANNGSKYKQCKFFYHAIQKYGWDSFEHTILIDNISKEKACVIEKELIKKYNTQDEKFGYNLASGGFGGCTVRGEKHFLSKKVYQYNLDGSYVREWENAQRASEELNIVVSDIALMCRKTSNIKKAGSYMWSYQKMDSMPPYIREGHSKESILQLDELFNIVAQYRNISYVDNTMFDREKITNCCKKRSLTHRGFYWVYKKDFDANAFKDYVSKRVNDRKFSNKCSKPILQCDLQGNVLKSYRSARCVEEETGFNRHTIQAYCKRNIGDSGISTGYIWKYA